ncbi:myosin-IIIa-like, partial, partial [Paramuricea clavata]
MATRKDHHHHHHNKLKHFKTPVDWQLLEKVGDGSFGAVYKLKNVKSGHLAAVKVIGGFQERTIEDVLHEMDILKKLSNQPNVVQFIGAFKFKSKSYGDQLWLVMELCRGGSVTALVKRLIRAGSCLSEDLIAFIIHETLKGLEVLHEKNVMHRDIKGANILLTSNAGVKLVDF